MTGDGVVGDTEAALFVRLMEPHVNPSPVLLGPRPVCLPGPFLEEDVGDLEIDMLLLEAVLICEVNLGTREEPGTLTQGAPVFPGSSRLGIEPKTPGWLV